MDTTTNVGVGALATTVAVGLLDTRAQEPDDFEPDVAANLPRTSDALVGAARIFEHIEFRVPRHRPTGFLARRPRDPAYHSHTGYTSWSTHRCQTNRAGRRSGRHVPDSNPLFMNSTHIESTQFVTQSRSEHVAEEAG